MLGKIIVSGRTREGARRLLLDALDDSAVFGLTTNLGFLRRLVASDEFRDAAIDTAWLDRSPNALPQETPDLAIVAAGWALASAGVTGDDVSPFAAGDGWRLAGPPAPVVLELQHQGQPLVLAVDRASGRVTEAPGDEAERHWDVREVASDGDRLRLDVDGVLSEVMIEMLPSGELTVGIHGAALSFTPRDSTASAAHLLSDGSVVAPMPGTVREVSAAVGQVVSMGDVLGVMEAMKMELSLRAPIEGTVTEVAAVAGSQVSLGQRLFAVTAADGVREERSA